MKSFFSFMSLTVLLISCSGESKEETTQTIHSNQSSAVDEDELFMSFDFIDGKIENGFGDWFYSDKGEDPCNVWAGEKRSKLCTKSGYKAYIYYNNYGNSHMGWLRHSYIDASVKHVVRGNSLKLQTTGGAYRNEIGEVEYRGIEARSKSDIPESFEFINPDEAPSYLGNLSLYIKPPTNTSKFPKLQNKNRLSIWLLMPKDNFDFNTFSAEHASSTGHRVSWYPFINRGTGGHYYHRSANVPMGGWTKIQFDAHPSHHNGGIPYPYNGFQAGGNEFPGDGASYFSNIATMAFVFRATKKQLRYTEFYIDELTTNFFEYENEETINNIGIGYNPESNLFDVSFEDKYRCLLCSATYEIKYSFSPINNKNYKDAYTPSNTINFHRSKNNSEGKIYKPNRGYNLLWAALELQEEHKNKLFPHTKIYFAVKDTSQRKDIEQHEVDFQLVDVPGLGNIRKMDLIKSIEYEIIPVQSTDLSSLLPDRKPLKSEVQPCVVIVDFKSSIKESKIIDSRFHTIEKDQYTGFNKYETTLVIGTNLNYDFQKVIRKEFTIIEGGQVRLIWKNISNSSITFSPRVSFTDPDRMSNLDTSGWYNASELSLQPGDSGVSKLRLLKDITSTFINVNVNYSNNQSLVLDRIELEEQKKTKSDTCQTFDN